MYVIKRVTGYSKGRYMAEGLVHTTPNLSEAHTFQSKDDAQVMATPKHEVVVSLEQERNVEYSFSV